MDINETRKLQKLLHLNQEQIYHVFCLAMAMEILDGGIEAAQAEVLTRIGFGLGLQPKDIEEISKSAQEGIKETSVSDVLAFSIVRLKQLLAKEQLEGIVLILEYTANSDRNISASESEVIRIARDVWFKDEV